MAFAGKVVKIVIDRASRQSGIALQERDIMNPSSLRRLLGSEEKKLFIVFDYDRVVYIS